VTDAGASPTVAPLGPEEAPFVCEVKARKDGSGFAQLERWLGDFDLLALRRNKADPLIILPWRVWATLPSKVPRAAESNCRANASST
jgi:hypothetical protein